MAQYIQNLENVRGVPLSFKRQFATPLDADSVFYNSYTTNDDGEIEEITAYANALEYAKSSTAYIGQIITAVDIAKQGEYKINPYTKEAITFVNDNFELSRLTYSEGEIKNYRTYKVTRYGLIPLEQNETDINLKFKGYITDEPGPNDFFESYKPGETQAGAFFIASGDFNLPYKAIDINQIQDIVDQEVDDTNLPFLFFPSENQYYELTKAEHEEKDIYIFPIFDNAYDFSIKNYFYLEGFNDEQTESGEIFTNNYRIPETGDYGVDNFIKISPTYNDKVFCKFKITLNQPKTNNDNDHYCQYPCKLSKIILQNQSFITKVRQGDMLIWDGYVWHVVSVGTQSGTLPGAITTKDISDFDQAVDTKINTALNTFANSEALAEQVESSVIKYMEDSSIILHGGTASSAPNNPIDI